jgi:hypothetical protein
MTAAVARAPLLLSRHPLSTLPEEAQDRWAREGGGRRMAVLPPAHGSWRGLELLRCLFESDTSKRKTLGYQLMKGGAVPVVRGVHSTHEASEGSHFVSSSMTLP